jgi:hypothetical protein
MIFYILSRGEAPNSFFGKKPKKLSLKTVEFSPTHHSPTKTEKTQNHPNTLQKHLEGMILRWYGGVAGPNFAQLNLTIVKQMGLTNNFPE